MMCDLCHPACRGWLNCLIVTISFCLCVGMILMLVGSLVPKQPSPGAKKELTARQYEALEADYARRAYLLDVVTLVGLGWLLLGIVILSTLHVVVYCRGYELITAFPAHFERRTTRQKVVSATPLSEILVLTSMTSPAYGGLGQTTQ